MVEAQTAGETGVGKVEDIILLVFCSLIAVGGLAVVVWQLVMGRLLSIDGLCLAAICLSLSAVFGGNVAWSFYNGELKMVFGGGSKEPAAAAPAAAPAAPAPPTPSGKK